MNASLAEKVHEGLSLNSIGGLALPVDNAVSCRDFYENALGLKPIGSDVLPGLGAHILLCAPSGQWIALCEADGPALSEMGVHYGFRCSPTGRQAIADRLQASGVDTHDYREDRPAERDDNFYFHDPSGNRLQLVVGPDDPQAAGVSAIDHRILMVFDMLWAERFYVHGLGLPVEHRVGWMTADHAMARKWAAGEQDMAPGTRRLDKLYMTMGGQNEVPRANMQIFMETGSSILGLYLATQHFQEPPEGTLTGPPRTAFFTVEPALDNAAALLESLGTPFEGPIAHSPTSPLASSLYFKDPSSNFLEICTVRTV